jgi:two-component system nitrate/nitrite response regulator NarL
LELVSQEQRRDSIILSERENQILRCLIKGLSNKGIARELRIAEATVKVHVKGILRKVCAKNRTQAAIWALNNMSEVETVRHISEPHPADTSKGRVPA